MLLEVLHELLNGPIPIEPSTCVLASLSLGGKLLPFHGLIPSIQQAIPLGFEGSIVPPIVMDFFGDEQSVEFVPIRDVAHN